MNAQSILFIAAVIASGNVLAQQHAQQNGRDSVYARPGMSLNTTGHSQATAVARNGRGSVFAFDLPAPSRSSQYVGVAQKFGRA